MKELSGGKMAIRQVILMVRHVRTITNFVISG